MVLADYQGTASPDSAVRGIPKGGGEDLSPRLLAAFTQYGRRFTKDSTLLLEGDECRAVYYVLAGWLTLSKALEEGQNQIIDFALPGDIVEAAAADGKMASVSVEALTEGVLAAFPSHKWENMICDLPELHRLAHRVEAARQARRAERMLRLGKGSAEMRLAYAIVEFCIRIDSVSDAEVPEFHIPLTQQQLGDYVGLSSVHVCRTIRRLARNGILEMHDHMDIRVLDFRALARLAGVDIETLKREILPYTA